MKRGSITLLLGVFFLSTGSVLAKPASVASISPQDLVEFESQPLVIRVLIEKALKLTEKKLTYQFGSNSPRNPGMDCSGTIQFTLREMGMDDAPRSSFHMYQWAKKKGKLVSTKGVTSVEDPVFAKLKPGDLLFWEGTYDTGKQNPPISHVMIYLGRLKEDGKGVVFGSSDGRRFRGKRITGVSVFDWKVPSKGSTSKFVGYASIPGFTLEDQARSLQETRPDGKIVEKSEETATIKSGLDKLFRSRDASAE